MTKNVFDCREINLSHAQMVSLRKLGKLRLGLDEVLAMKIATSGVVKNRSVGYAFNFWRFATVAAFLFSIYLSFTSHWWCFVPGLVAAGVMIKATNAGNVSNLIDTAMEDKEFYEQVRQINGWQYLIGDNEAAAYRTG